MENFEQILNYSLPIIIMALITMVLVGIIKAFFKGKYESPWFPRLYIFLAVAFSVGTVTAYYHFILHQPIFTGLPFFRDIAAVYTASQALYQLYRKCGGRTFLLWLLKVFKGKNVDLDKLIEEVEKILKNNVTLIPEQEENIHKELMELKENVKKG